VTAQTPLYGIKYLVNGEPIRNTRQALEDNAKTIEAALASVPMSAPGATDLAAVAARVGVVEHVNDAVTDLSRGANVNNVAGYRNAGVYRVGRAVCLTSLLTTGAALGAGAALFTLASGFRPASGVIIPLLLNAQTGSPLVNSSIRADVNGTTGVVSTVAALPSGSYLFLDSVQFPGA
jgi:hypothetical protein